MDFNYILRSIFALILIIWLANVLLGKLNQYIQRQSTSIQVIERFSINKNSSLAIVKVVNTYYLMSFNENNSEILKEFAAEEVNDILDVMREQEKERARSSIAALDLTKIKRKYADFFGKNQK